MPTLKEVLADKANYQDNLAWNLGNNMTVTLGQLRALSAEDQGAITKAEAKLAEDRRAFEAQQAELKKAQVNTGNLYTTMQSALAALKSGNVNDPSVKALFPDALPPIGNNTNNNDPFAALARLEGDTLIGPLVNVVKLVNAEAKKAQEAVAQNLEVQKKMASNYLNGVLEDRYDRVVPADKQDKFTIKALIESAVAAQQFSSDGTPNIKWAYKNATAGDDRAAHDAEVAAAAVKKYQADQAAAGRGSVDGSGIFVPTPQNFGLDVHNRTGAAPKPFKSLDEAFAAAEKDTSIWNAVDGAVQ